MGKPALLLAIMAAMWGDYAVNSFSFAPGALQQQASLLGTRSTQQQQQQRRRRQQSPAWAGISSSSLGFAREGRRGSTEGCLLGATTTAAVAESPDYLENKEALKQVCLLVLSQTKKQN